MLFGDLERTLIGAKRHILRKFAIYDFLASQEFLFSSFGPFTFFGPFSSIYSMND